MAMAILGLGATTPANAEETAESEIELFESSSSLRLTSADSAVLDGPGGSLGITQEQTNTSSRSALQDQTGLGVDGVELLLRSRIESSDQDGAVYSLDLPEGASTEVMTNEDGEDSVLIFTKDGEFLGGLASLDASDASGDIVPTFFEVEGSTVMQKVAPESGADYPVTVAASGSTAWYSAGWVTTNSKGYIVNANPTTLGRQQTASNVYDLHVRDLKYILGSQAYRVNRNIEKQFLCHVYYGWAAASGVYNMESWSPESSFNHLILPWVRCNV